MFKTLLIILSTLLFVLNSYTQDTLTPKEFRNLKRQMAKDDIRALKKSVLLVQLKTKQHTIDAYIRKGNTKKAEKIKNLLNQDNKNIIKGFKEYFTFCPVYFYYSTDMKKVKSKDLSSVSFLDDSLKVKAISVNFDTTNYYLANIGTSNYQNTTLNNIPNFKIEYNNYVNFEALLIKNKEFQQLSVPFPYYTKTHEKIKVSDIKRWETIKKMNARLHNFYQLNK